MLAKVPLPPLIKEAFIPRVRPHSYAQNTHLFPTYGLFTFTGVACRSQGNHTVSPEFTCENVTTYIEDSGGE